MKNFALIFLILLSLTITGQIAVGRMDTIDLSGEDPNALITGFVPESPINEPNDFLGVIASIAQWIYAIFFITAVAFILFAAFNYLTGGDEPEKIKTSHKQLTYAAIAIVIALTAVGASLIVKTFLLSGA